MRLAWAAYQEPNKTKAPEHLEAWESRWMVQHLPNMPQNLGLSFSTQRKRKEKKGGERRGERLEVELSGPGLAVVV